MINLIAACSLNGVIGVSNKIPWNCPSDMKHFREMTKNSTVILGRSTFESMGSKPLPKRRNLVITSRDLLDGVECYPSIQDALNASSNDESIWFIGGSRIYEQSMQFADEIHLTIIPEIINDINAVKFPWINPEMFKVKEIKLLNPDENLKYVIYGKI